MKNHISLLFSLFCISIFAQGPPITADKPIMLGGKSFTVKTLTEIRTTNQGTSVYTPFMFHYLPTANSLIAVHVPFIATDFSENLSLADLQILGKYQFFRKDGTGKTFRMVAKTLQNLPTGKEIGVMRQSTGFYQGYYGLVTGYESLRFGISSEIGFNYSEFSNLNEQVTKLGFGLPLLKPKYPNEQINLFFEYSSNWFTHVGEYQLLYAQGIQYALKNITFDLAVQLPLISDVEKINKFKNSMFIGTRYTF